VIRFLDILNLLRIMLPILADPKRKGLQSASVS
jgi:hypothetical protein